MLQLIGLTKLVLYYDGVFLRLQCILNFILSLSQSMVAMNKVMDPMKTAQTMRGV